MIVSHSTSTGPGKQQKLQTDLQTNAASPAGRAVFLFAAFVVLLIIYLKKRHPYNLPLYMILYGIFRFVIEYFRGDERGSFVPGMSPSQFWSLLMVIAAIPLIFVLKKAWAKRRAELLENGNELSPGGEPAKK